MTSGFNDWPRITKLVMKEKGVIPGHPAPEPVLLVVMLNKWWVM